MASNDDLQSEINFLTSENTALKTVIAANEQFRAADLELRLASEDRIKILEQEGKRLKDKVKYLEKDKQRFEDFLIMQPILPNQAVSFPVHMQNYTHPRRTTNCISYNRSTRKGRIFGWKQQPVSQRW